MDSTLYILVIGEIIAIVIAIISLLGIGQGLKDRQIIMRAQESIERLEHSILNRLENIEKQLSNKEDILNQIRSWIRRSDQEREERHRWQSEMEDFKRKTEIFALEIKVEMRRVNAKIEVLKKHLKINPDEENLQR